MPNSVITKMDSAEVGSQLSKSDDVQLIDVRTPLEFESEHIADSVNIPLDELGKRSIEIRKDKMSIMVCRSGNRATRAADMLAEYGYKVGVLDGGMIQWKKDGMPSIEGTKRLSIERQTQLTIGLILLGSTAAGFTKNRGFFAFSALIGAGLTFAGITGTCGLGLLLAKAPWNQLNSKLKSNVKSELKSQEKSSARDAGNGKSCCS